ncbi:Uncharacterised protein [Anaerobiospirillum thomasii]|uniref:hypothetical protein n=1 Tax=Anaerobiospirillum thomasii TaxID=179995 RepID=UPI000D9EA9A9|nr:hypothetical protein [Anaerobiospirillum thomasii]SPT68704.1 Uncharacterised protein [Anaerobiospirillum thomasii]
MEQNKYELLKTLLDDLSKTTSNKKDPEEYAAQLRHIYSNNFRHSYSDISLFLLRNQDNNNLAEYVSFIAEGLKAIKDIIYDKYSTETSLKNSVSKLHDHIHLESVRLNYVTYKLSNIDQEIAETNNLINEFNLKLKKSKKDINKLSTQYITILGIFASIVITVFVGFNLVTSVFSNIANTDIHKISFFCCLVGFIIFNTVIALLSFLSKIASIKLHTYIILILAIADIVLMSGVCFFYNSSL